MILRICFVLIFLFSMVEASLPVYADDASSSLSALSSSPSFFNQKGMDELRAGNPGVAVDFFLKAISLDSRQKYYYNNLAAAYIRLSEYSKAEEQLKMSLAIDGNFATALSNMAVTLFHLGRYRESYSYYRLSKKADSEYTEKRFDKSRVSSVVKKMSNEKPDDEELKRIKEYMESAD